jgi:hypothetical protein
MIIFAVRRLEMTKPPGEDASPIAGLYPCLRPMDAQQYHLPDAEGYCDKHILKGILNETPIRDRFVDLLDIWYLRVSACRGVDV